MSTITHTLAEFAQYTLNVARIIVGVLAFTGLFIISVM